MKNIILYKHKDKNIYLYIFDKCVYYLSNERLLDGSRPYYENADLKKYLKICKFTNTKYSWYCGGESFFWGKSNFDFYDNEISRNKHEYILINIGFKFKKIKFV
jgi:hypothetical protein